MPDVSTPSKSYEQMRVDYSWDLLTVLVGGTKSIRDAGETYLPRHEKESIQAWESRRERSYLFEAYGDTLGRMVSRPFSKPTTGSDDLTGRFEHFLENVDGNGTDITQFSRNVFKDALDRGMSHVFVDFPAGFSENKAVEDDKMPRWIHIKAEDLLGARFEVVNGKKKFTRIRFREWVCEAEGEYGEVSVETIRVVNSGGTWSLEKKVGDTWIEMEQGTWTYAGDLDKGIPLETVNLNPEGFMLAKPCFLALAWLNLQHWMKSSDLDNFISFSRIGILFGAGFSSAEQKKGIVIAPNRAVFASAADATLAYVTAPKDSVAIGSEDIDRLQRRMEVLGLKPLMERSGSTTALERSVDENDCVCDLQAWARTMENMLNRSMVVSAGWTNEKLPKDYALSVYDDFAITANDKELAVLAGMLKDSKLPLEIMLKELKRRGILHESVDIAEVVAMVEDMVEPIPPEPGDDGEPEEETPFVEEEDEPETKAA